jgi:hypothetical protein
LRLRKLASGDFGGCCQCECAGYRHTNVVVPIRDSKKAGHDLKVRSEIFKPVALFPPKLRGQDFELSLLSPELLPNPVGPVLQVAANVAHFFAFGLSHGVVPPSAHAQLS